MTKVKFNVIEAADAASFNIYKDQTANIAGTVSLTISFPDTDVDDVTITLSEVELAELNSDDGLNITTAKVSAPNTTFTDGIYVFTLTEAATGFFDSTITEAFGAIITDRTIKELLSYRVYLTPGQKEWMLEKTQLLTNLRLSASVGAANQYQTNLEVLERMR